MDSGTPGYDDEGYGDAYWRRRALALGAVLLVVGGITWSCVGEDAPARKTVAAGSASPTPTPEPSATGTEAFVIPTVTFTATVTATVAAPRQPGDACAKNSVVATVIPAKAVFRTGERPSFQVTVVNTGKLDCTFDVGAEHFVARITTGPYKIWSSAHCPSGGASSIQMLRRGIPYTTTFEWNRRRSSSGSCSTPQSKAVPGTYTVRGFAPGVKTPKETFTLVAPP
ncbi:hypothetical protein LO762_24180 [Actinocorallia sp. API 0066]|uniref:hypothetical protein n=1 Tax=Actinocorallia sp. API 0066 TaxID=2896846 RepID=UPI001E5D4C4A|nr:hypothetical protein [Actinocorallia sp. API 0066]MCD0452266.1 hypothetical protein [Actinocorallia sp. API 0066]